MRGVQITLSAELLEAASVNPADASGELAKLLALGRAAELCRTPLEAFMVFAGKHGAPMHYSVSNLDEDRLRLGHRVRRRRRHQFVRVAVARRYPNELV
jgi:hypothetical protein